MKDNLKFPDGLVTKFEYNSKSLESDRNKEAWIMSVSKTFCAATAAIMAVDGEFGDNKINATLLDVLNKAESKYPERQEKINKYRQMINEVGCGNVTMLELLSHRSGLRNGDHYLYQKDANLDPDKLNEKEKEQFRMNVYGDKSLFSFDPTMRQSSFAYCNLGFVLAEDMMNLVVDQDYYAELKNRILTPLKLDNTKSIYESEEARKGISDNVIVKDVIYDYNYNLPRKENVREDCLRNTKKGYIALSEGGLCSTVADLEKFYGELSNLVCGMENKLQNDSQKIAEIRKHYVEARKLGKNLNGLGKNYSLGLAIEDKGDEGILLWHSGGHPGNNAFAKVHMNISIEDFMNTSSNPNIKDVATNLDVSIKQQDVFARDSILTIISCDYISKINQYFRDKCDQSDYEKYGDPSNALNEYKKYGDPSNVLQDYEYEEYNKKARTWDYASQEWQKELIDQKRLPQNFGDFHNQIRKTYEPAQESLNQYVKEHFCDEKGVIDSNKVAEIKNLDDFNKIVEAIKPQLSKAREEISNVFKDCDRVLDKMNHKSLEFKDPQAINNAVLVSQNIEDLKFGKKVISKSFSGDGGVALSCGVADVKYENEKYQISQYNFSQNNENNLIFSIDSNAKMLTAVAILRMLEEGIYKKYFPQGIDTKLSYFAEVLSEKFPNSKYFKEELVKDPNYQKITIKDLAQHTSGLLQVDKNSFSFAEKIVKNHQKLSLDDMIDLEKIKRDDSWGQKQGEYLYNNIDYEILGRILIGVASKENNKNTTFGDIINELVIARVKEKIIANDKVNGKEIAENLKYFTSDQILYINNKSKIDNKFNKQQDLTIAETKNFYGGQLIEIPSHFYDLACGGSYADPVSQALIAMHILANNDKFSIFKDENIQKIFNEQKIEQYDGKNENSKAETYGFGYMAFSDLAWKDYRTHNGGGFGSNSSTIIDLKNNRAIFSVVHFEDLTMPIAYAINKGQLSEEKWQEDKKTIKLNNDIYQTSLELWQKYKEEEILAMRNALEKSNEEFWKIYNSLAKPQINNEILPQNNLHLQDSKIDEKLKKITTNENQQS